MLLRISAMFCLSLIVSQLRAQCGLDPLSGTNIVSTPLQIVNSYYTGMGSPVQGVTSLTLGTLDSRSTAPALAANDLILIIQMQGSDFTASNDDAYGNGVAGGTASGYNVSNLRAGNYEYNTVLSVAGATVTLAYALANSYYTNTFGANGKQAYQIIRIPRNYNLTINSGASVTAPSWNGSTGGVVVLDAANIITINGSITVAGLGFRGGGGMNLTGVTTGNSNGSTTLTITDYRFNSPVTNTANLTGGSKGEGIAGTPAYILNNGSTTVTVNTQEGYINGSMGRGAPANAGGGATDGAMTNTNNSGGGGGSNAGVGGQGGSGWHGVTGDVTTFPTGGHGGAAFSERSVSRFIMGGGGGAGSANNSTAINQYMCSGSSGGGIILTRAGSYAGNGSLNANGTDATSVTTSGSNTDAAGGGGAGGTIVAVTRMNVTVGLSLITATARGGKGGNMETHFDHGPGGGGGGGLLVTNGAFASTMLTAGINGLTRTGTAAGPINNAYGSTSGTDGQLITMTSAPILKNTFDLASPCGTLPILLKSFTAVSDGSQVMLNWKIENAVNFSHFEIEHSTTGLAFTKIGSAYFEVGRSTYNFSHMPADKLTNYYRLKMLNSDGHSTYSNVVLVRPADETPRFTVFPQPARDVVYISLDVKEAGTIELRLFNSTGSQVREMTKQLHKGNNEIKLENLAQLPAGVYILKSKIEGHSFAIRILKGNE